MVILSDIDDVLQNFVPCWIKVLNEKHHTDVKLEDIVDWDIARFFPSLTREEVFWPIHQDFFLDLLSPNPGAPEYVKRLIDDGHEVYLVTATDYRNIRAKFEHFVQKYFPFISWNQVIVTSNKQMLKGDVLVDDAVHNLENGDYQKILFSAPHNKNYDAEAHGMIRADNWKEVYYIISKLEV